MFQVSQKTLSGEEGAQRTRGFLLYNCFYLISM